MLILNNPVNPVSLSSTIGSLHFVPICGLVYDDTFHSDTPLNEHHNYESIPNSHYTIFSRSTDYTF
jgi:hypothetical protein